MWPRAHGFVPSQGRLLHRAALTQLLLHGPLLPPAHPLQGPAVINWHKLQKAERSVPLRSVPRGHFTAPWLNASSSPCTTSEFLRDQLQHRKETLSLHFIKLHKYTVYQTEEITAAYWASFAAVCRAVCRPYTASCSRVQENNSVHELCQYF